MSLGPEAWCQIQSHPIIPVSALPLLPRLLFSVLWGLFLLPQCTGLDPHPLVPALSHPTLRFLLCIYTIEHQRGWDICPCSGFQQVLPHLLCPHPF